MSRKSTIPHEDMVKYAEAYEEYNHFELAARALNVPRWKVVRSVYRLQGRCDCGRELNGEKGSCSVCQARACKGKMRRYKERKIKGLCVQCGKPREKDSPSTVYCKAHNKRQNMQLKAKRETRRKFGLCLTCGSSLDTTDKTYCSKHVLKARKRKYKERVDKKYNGLYLEILERDNYKCTICEGDEPRLEIHHIKKEGGDTLENLTTLCLRCHHALTDLYNSPNPQGVYEFYLEHPEP